MNTYAGTLAWSRPVPALRGAAAITSGTVLVLALALTLASALLPLPVTTAWGQGGGPDKQLVPVPTRGIDVELWSDPPAGSLVHEGGRARFYARPSDDCYLTIFSVDTEGRMRLMYPRAFDDGWVPAGQTCTVPGPGDGYDLVFTGPSGMEYVYALASSYPLRSRYPAWMAQGMGPAPLPDDWSEDDDAYSTGWVVGDPFYQVRNFCEELVPYPDEHDTYATAWVSFYLGQRVTYPRFLCSDCHFGGYVDPYGPVCSAVRIRIGDHHYSGFFDFHVSWIPTYTYEVWSGWRPRRWTGGRWNGPDGRWVWSSADGHHLLHDRFHDAAPPDHDRTGPWGRDHGRDNPRQNPPDGRVVDGRDGRPDGRRIEGGITPPRDGRRIEGGITPPRDGRRIEGGVTPPRDGRRIEGGVTPPLDGRRIDGRDPRPDGRRIEGRDQRPGGGRVDGRDTPPADRRIERRPEQPTRPNNAGPWVRGFQERLRRSVREKGEAPQVRPETRRPPESGDRPSRGREQEVRKPEARPGVPTPRPPTATDRGTRGESRHPQGNAPRESERSPRQERGRSR